MARDRLDDIEFDSLRRGCYRISIFYLVGTVCSIFLVGAPFLIFLHYGVSHDSTAAKTTSVVLGILATIIAVLQWLPQIIHTFRLKSCGSLSLLMVFIHIPGCITSVVTSAISRAKFTSYINLIFASVLEILLLTIGIIYRNKEYKVRKAEDPTINYYVFMGVPKKWVRSYRENPEEEPLIANASPPEGSALLNGE